MGRMRSLDPDRLRDSLHKANKQRLVKHIIEERRTENINVLRQRHKWLSYLGITPVRKKEWFTFFMLGLAIFVLVAITIYDFIFLRGMLTYFGLFSAGIIMIAIGLLLRIAGALTLGKYFSIHVEIAPDHALIDKGLYRLIRHPMYTGALLMGLGIATMFSSGWGTLCFFFVYLPAFMYRIEIEERYLESRFGEYYLQYKRRTKRLIPGIY